MEQPATRELAVRAGYDCHVNEGRAALSFSDLNTVAGKKARDTTEAIAEGDGD